MPYDYYWNGDPILTRVYRESHEIRNEIKNQELWLQGVYNFKAFSSVIESLAYGIAGGKGSKPSRYPEEPLPLSEKDQQAEMERNKQRTLAWVQQNQQ